MDHQLVITNKISQIYCHFARHSMKSNDGYSLLVCVFVLCSFFIRSFIYIYAYHFSQFVHPLDINEKQREKEEFLWLFWRTFALKNELMPYREEKVVIIKPTREKKNVNSPLYSSSSSFACTST
jgi:hypothetical protein